MATQSNSDSAGFVSVSPGDANYPTAAQLAKLKGVKIPVIRVMEDAMGDIPEPHELDELLASSDVLPDPDPAVLDASLIRRRLRS